MSELLGKIVKVQQGGETCVGIVVSDFAYNPNVDGKPPVYPEGHERAGHRTRDTSKVRVLLLMPDVGVAFDRAECEPPSYAPPTGKGSKASKAGA